jgi:hypothetical protein
MKRLAIVLFLAGALCSAALGQSPAPVSTPVPMHSGTAALVRFSGQVLDYQHGFLFFTTGDGFRVAPDVRITDASGKPTQTLPQTRMYALAGFDAQSGQVTEIALSGRPIPGGVAYESIKQYAVVKSAQQTNPDFKKKGVAIEGKPVLVTFIVTVPPNTPLTDQVYISTDKSGWLPNAIRMDRIDALRYRYTAKLLSGTDLDYLFTRGTWTTVERGRNGLEQPPHHIFVGNLDTENRSNQVYYWADVGTGGGAPAAQATFNPSALPTPFNPSPFNFPQPGHYGTPGPFPTPNPNPTKPPR